MSTPDSLAARSAFPERLTNDAEVIIATLRSMKTGVSIETVGPVVVHDGPISIPYRIHLPQLERAQLAGLRSAQALMGSLFTRDTITDAYARRLFSLGECIYDGAVGSAGFLCEAFDHLRTENPKRTTAQDNTLQERTFYGKER